MYSRLLQPFQCCVRENGFPSLSLISGGFAASSTSLFNQSTYPLAWRHSLVPPTTGTVQTKYFLNQIIPSASLNSAN
ncbi:hypothetical protein B5X24_HaOG210530 [Helicoverpa armigera]|uniref:Uncharacterized protein n=1 Tax=Helicoverpa armigera TaxID=29058 RepID=A0A2W1BHZ5_HELAM|nr:hypothetical protein B5X24_HaOG210530 [Helicoverpa armigera]